LFAKEEQIDCLTLYDTAVGHSLFV
jgi:hypothetical protein